MSHSTTHHVNFVPPVRTGNRRRPLAAWVALALALLAFLGFAITHLGASASSGAPTAPPPGPPRLMKRAIAPATLPGFSLLMDPATIRGAVAWATAERSPSQPRESARLQTLGFIDGLDEQLRSTDPTKGQVSSIVEQFRTPSGAQSELQHQYATVRASGGARLTTFPVVGVPGARGVSILHSRHTRLEVLFRSGRFVYLLTAGSPLHGGPRVTSTRLASAVGLQYLTVNGCVSSR